MGDMTKNFNRAEFACKCGCGKDNIDPKPPRLAQKVRDKLNMPVRVNSGVRCEKRNRAVGGVENSYHVQGLAPVVERLDDMISLPWYLEWLDGPLIGWLVDLVCGELNWLSDNDFTGLELTEQEAATIVEGICYSVADVPYSEGVKESASERIEEIEARIGITRRLEDAPGAPDVAESENDHTPWQTPFWSESSKPALTPPLSEEERQRREANFQKAIEFVLKWIERRNFNVVNSEPVMKAAIGDDGHGPVAWGISIPALKTCEPRELAAAIIRHNREYCEQIAALDTSMQHLDAMAKEAGVAVEETEEDNVD